MPQVAPLSVPEQPTVTVASTVATGTVAGADTFKAAHQGDGGNRSLLGPAYEVFQGEEEEGEEEEEKASWKLAKAR